MTPNPCVELTGKRQRFACRLPAAHAYRSASCGSAGRVRGSDVQAIAAAAGVG
jgi:hypothetical protein